MASSLRAKYKRPSPLQFGKPLPEPRLSTFSTLPDTVYHPEDDEVDNLDDPSTPETPSDAAGMFRGYSPSSSSSSLSAREISPPITPTNEVYHGRKIKRKGSSANMRGSPGINYTNKPRLSKYAHQAPTTPATPLSGLDSFPANVLAVVTPAVTPASNNIAEFQTVPIQLAPSRPSTAPEPYKIIIDERVASPKSNSVLGIGVKYPLRRRGHLSQQTLPKKPAEPILGDWEVSDEELEKPPQQLELKPWPALQVVRKSSAPAILSCGNVEEAGTLDSVSDTTSELNCTCGVPLLNLDSSSDNTSVPSIHENIIEEDEEDEDEAGVVIEQPAEPVEVPAEEVMEQVVEVQDEEKARARILSQPMYSQSVVDVTSPASSPKKSPFTFGGHRDIELPQRSPSAPIVTTSMSAVSFDTSEDFPVMFSELPVDETEIFNIIPNDYIMADVLGKDLEELNNPDYQISPAREEYTVHPSWQQFDQDEHKLATVTQSKTGLDELVEMMDPDSPIAKSFRDRYNSTPSMPTTELAVPSPASLRPGSRWSDYSVDDDAKESWRSSVMNRFHIPHVGMDLKRAVAAAAAKGGIINRRLKATAEPSLVEEETMSIHGGSPSPRNSTATDTDSITETTITTITGPPPNNRNSTASSGSGLTGFKMGRIGSGGSIRHGRAASIRTVATGRAATIRGASSDEELSDDERRAKVGFKGVFEKYVVRDAKRRKEDRRREELKRTIRVVGGGKGGDWI
ncbi:hypothetical protein C7212DRAFT_349351 [Tuber magnatum]|uniref:Uncharacterized protein n=1 Tax=Tuber magnatum TaxID=42249 RepID=A0A317SZB6_9PEZI|nr:hypothetical protein C7212DRAFT_349351 [Tuber magnatum]